MTNLRIDVAGTAEEFAALRDEWTDLLESSRSDTIFLTWEWLFTWWKHFGQQKRLFIVTVRSQAQLLAIAPLTLRRTFMGSLAEFGGSGTIGSDYLDLIVRRGCETTVIDALTKFFDDADVSLRLPRVRKASAVAVSLASSIAEKGWEHGEVLTEVCPYIEIGGVTWEEYLQTLGPSHRYNFKRRLRNLERDYDVRMHYAQNEDERRDALKQVVSLHLKRWETRGGSDAFDTGRLFAFHDEFTAEALKQGWLRLSVMTLDGQPAAAFYSLRYRGTFSFYQSGFDPSFVSSSVGLVMMGLTIRDAIAEGAAEFDLLHGTETYKSLWSRSARQLVRLELYVPGAAGRVQSATASAKRLAKRILQVTA